MAIENPYHEGERWVQDQVHESAEARRSGDVIDDRIPQNALSFAAQQPMAVIGSISSDGTVWASLLFGEPGFIQAQSPKRVEVDLSRALVRREDPMWTNLEHDPRIGILLIELTTRRRLRVNGVSEHGEDHLTVEVKEAYPNCPKYIQRREFSPPIETLTASSNWESGRTLKPEHRTLVEEADTFFVASAHPEGKLDASHRGGDPGFVQFVSDDTIRIPDYPGNSMFNTLGNFHLYPHGGLVFLDFDRPRTLQFVGQTSIELDADDAPQFTGGSGRYWELEIDRWREGSLPQDWTWDFLDASPHNPETTPS